MSIHNIVTKSAFVIHKSCTPQQYKNKNQLKFWIEAVWVCFLIICVIEMKLESLNIRSFDCAFQLRRVPVTEADNAELEEEADWIYHQAFLTPTISNQVSFLAVFPPKDANYIFPRSMYFHF